MSLSFGSKSRSFQKKRVRLSTNHHSQTSKKVGALCIGYEYSFFSLGMKKRKTFRPKFYNLFDAYEQKNNFLKFRDEKRFFFSSSITFFMVRNRKRILFLET